MDIQPLIGDVQSQFLVGKTELMAQSIERAREDQEAMCGYPLVVKSTRMVEMRDEKDQLVIEVFATFAPAPDA
jgi:hypothetical protein